jgi:hypothetical protein
MWRLVVDPYSVTEYSDDNQTIISKVQGRVEKYSYNWGSVCDDVFDNDGNGAAQVFCGSLGLPKEGAIPLNYIWESNSNDILMDDVWCNGDEYDLSYCSYTTNHNCGHSEDVGVICQGGEGDDGTPKTIEWGNFRMVINPNS